MTISTHIIPGFMTNLIHNNYVGFQMTFVLIIK